jgi:signal transduction histidine kinase
MIADPDELEIVLNNLVSNAVKYNRDGGSVTVALAREGDTVRITVADTGIGMTPEESAKLFTEFVRIKNEDTIKILGSGLGLSTVRKLAQMYGGDASVKSERGSGSIFTVILRDAAPQHYRFSSIVLGIVKSAPFQMRRSDS